VELSLVRIATVQQAHDMLERLSCHPAGVNLMAPKTLLVGIRIDGLLPQAANILKQEMLAKGGEVAVPASALRMDVDRVSCIAFGTPSQFARLDQVLQGQPFELPDIASRLRLLCTLAISKPSGHPFDAPTGIDVGGLVDCDKAPPGVRDHIANTVALAWNLLEQRCTFLVVEGSDSSVVRQVVERLAGRAACPVAAWIHGDEPVDTALSAPMVVEENRGMQPGVLSNGPLFALCSSPNPVDFLQKVVSAGVSPEKLFITCALALDPATPAAYLRALPRVDAVILRQQDIAAFSAATIASALTDLSRKGVCTFITDAPSVIGAALFAFHENPWSF
jgi:hypothetical protein